MYLTFEETSKLITSGKVLHIAGNENLLKKLPKGKWIGGSTEYFMSKEGGKVSAEHFSVREFPSFDDFLIKTYTLSNIKDVAVDAFDNGLSIVIIPFDSVVHKEYAQKAAEYKDIFMKNIVGWISGMNLNTAGQTPMAIDGTSAMSVTDKAVVLHLKAAANKTVNVNIVNIFSQDEATPVITFENEGFSAVKCLVDGKETVLADYISQNGIDTKLPLVGDYGGHGINISFKSIDDAGVHFYAPVFRDIKYRIAKKIGNYEKEFNSKISEIKETNIEFSCNCILNFLYGEFEGKKIDTFVGPITFGEIAYQLVNQTLVYVTVK